MTYKFEFFNNRIESMFKDKDAFWDPELHQELMPVLKQLRQTGEILGADFGVTPGIFGLAYELKGKTFRLNYTVDAKKKVIKFHEFYQVSHSIDWETALEQDLNCKKEETMYIPQIGDPHKFIRAIALIGEGTNNPVELGVSLGSKAKKDKDKARKGDYFGRALMALKLVERSQSVENTSSIYVLTTRGKLISSADQETRERLFAEALLGFYPIQMILGETRHGKQPLTKELIQEIIDRVTLGDCGGTTNPRRASSLRALVNWVTRWAGIAIQRGNSDGLQLYIPNIYAEKEE